MIFIFIIPQNFNFKNKKIISILSDFNRIKFKKFYKYCKGNIPAMIYQFNEIYKSFEINIVNNDIPFMNEEDEKVMFSRQKEILNALNIERK